MFHKPVLLQTALEFLAVVPGGKYLDCTLGLGGHTAGIINRGGLVLGIDQDPQSLNACPDLDGLIKIRANFTQLSEIANRFQWNPVAGILFDLGMSSFQLDDPDRGLSFQSKGPLDMRLDPGLSLTAADLLNALSETQLAGILTEFGEIPVSRELARKIISGRPLTSTSQLAAITGRWSRQVFQAVRIAVNAELAALETSLPQAYSLLAPEGRLVVISFHSLEDRIVKNQFKYLASQNLIKILTPKPVRPSAEEISANSRAKSAKLRSYRKI